MSPNARLRAGGLAPPTGGRTMSIPMSLGDLPLASSYFGVGAGKREGSDSNPCTPAPLTPLPYEMAFFKPPPPLLSAALRSTSYASAYTTTTDPASSRSNPITPVGEGYSSGDPHRDDPFSRLGIWLGGGSGNGFGSEGDPGSAGRTSKKRTRGSMDEGNEYLSPSSGFITGLGGGLGRSNSTYSKKSKSRSGPSTTGSGGSSVTGSMDGATYEQLSAGITPFGRSLRSGRSRSGSTGMKSNTSLTLGGLGTGAGTSVVGDGRGWDDSDWGSSRGSRAGSEEREVEWTEWEDGILQSILVHPIRPLAKPFPPGTLPEPTSLDELTNQVFALQARATHRRGLSVNQNHVGKDGTESKSESQKDVGEEWQHGWSQTRKRLFQIARLESKGLDSSLLASSPTPKKRTTRTSAKAGLAMTEDISADPLSTGLAPSASVEPFKGEPKTDPIHTAVKARLVRPSIKRVFSMDFLDAASMSLEGEEGAEMEQGEGDGTVVDRVQAETGPVGKEQGIGRVLRLSTTLQNSSRSLNGAVAGSSPASGAILESTEPSTLFTSVPLVDRLSLATPPLALSSAAPIARTPPAPLLARPSGPKRGPSWTKPVRPASLLQRGRSFTADDLVDSEDDMSDGRRGREEGDHQGKAMTPTESRCLQAMQASPPSSVSVQLSSPGGTDSSISPPETIIGSPHSTEPNPFASMLVIPATPETPKGNSSTKDPIKPPVMVNAALMMNLGLALRSPTRGPGLARSLSSSAVQDLEHRPHAQQLEFMRPVEPTQTEPCELLAPFPFAFEDLGKKAPVEKGSTVLQDAVVMEGRSESNDGGRRKLRRLASGFKLDSERQ